MYNGGYQALAAAIVLQAVKDYIKKAQEKARKKPNMIKKAGFYAIKQYFSATKLHFLIFIITFASKTY